MPNNSVLYFLNGYLTDKIDPNDINKDISSPDGNFSYSWAIIQQFQRLNWKVYCCVDKDKEIVDKYGKESFASFSKEKRWNAYKNINFIGLENVLNDNLPNVDVVLLEWRMVTKDNSLPKTNPDYSPDLEIQNKLLDYYKDKAKIVIFDLDLKFTNEDYERIKPWKVIQTALYPTSSKYTSVFIPFDFDEMFQHKTLIPQANKLLTYIGSDYNRRENIEKYILPFAKENPGKVHIVGKWMKDDQKDFRNKCEGVIFYDRVGARKFLELYSKSVAVPLLLPKNYEEIGFQTMRILESLLFASIPIGFDSTKGIDKFLPKELIVSKDNSLDTIIQYLNKGFFDRINLRKSLIEKLKFMDVKNFVDTLLSGGNF
jgi:hypothetical protein